VGVEPGILDSPELIEEWGMPKELILLNGDGHIWIALDYRNNKDEPAVVYIDNESNEAIILADCFDDFIERLYIEDRLYSFDPDEEERKSSRLSDEELIDMLQSKNFETIDDALFHLLKYPNNKITENFVFKLIDSKNRKIKDTVGVHFFLGARDGNIDPSILDKALKIFVKDRVLYSYADMIKELETSV